MSWYLREGYPTAYQSFFIVSLTEIITQFASISFASYIVGGTKYSTMKAYSCVIIFLTAVMATGVRGERYLRAEISNEEENDNMMMSFSYHQPVESYRTFRNSNDDIDMSAKEERATAVAMQAVVPSNSLTNQIICGYQGWYAYPGM